MSFAGHHEVRSPRGFVLRAVVLICALIALAIPTLCDQRFNELVTQAIAAQETGEWSLALDYYLQARELEPRNSIVLRNIGVAYSKMGRVLRGCGERFGNISER